MTEMTEWAVVIENVRTSQPRAVAFAIEKETDKFLMGRAFGRERQDKRDCTWPLSEARAKNLAEQLNHVRDVATNEINAAKAKANSARRELIARAKA